MHTVGRMYARDGDVTLANLMEHLPLSNDPGCSAGFAHGLVTGVAPDLDPSRPAESAASARTPTRAGSATAACTASGTPSCGSTPMSSSRRSSCASSSGADTAPDCAQGAYHDYWLAVIGADDATLSGRPVTDPRRLCGAQPEAFVRPCWYRAFLETRPDGFQIEAPRDLEDLCEGLEGVQREGCITGAAVIGPPDPAAQLEICAAARRPTRRRELRARHEGAEPAQGAPGRLRPADRGLRGLRPGGPARVLPLARQGDHRRHRRPLRAHGLPPAPAAARRECDEGARTIDEALVTFS